MPSGNLIDLEAIRRDYPLPGIVGATVKLYRAGNEWKACCPFHNEKTPSFTIFDAGRRFQCFGCGASGDVLDFVQLTQGVGLRDAAAMLAGGEMPAAEFVPIVPNVPDHDDADKLAQVRAIWNRTQEASGSLAEAYLRFRGVYPPFPSDIRFSRLPCDNLGPLPCLVAAVRDMAGEITGIQRIWLASDGLGKADVAKPKRSLGRVKGGAIRLGEFEGAGTVTVCEGPEDGLSLLEMLGAPVWVAAGATFLPHMQFPPEVRSVVIGADNDPAGDRAAQDAARAFVLRGLTVRIIRPLDGHKDFNDELKGSRA
jgi:DNA primase